MTNYRTGHLAEKHAADYLAQQGYEIVACNWRTKYCEIDIIARKNKTVHFVEVKYRKTAWQGTGLDYITPAKLKQMRFAAELWVNEQDWSNDYVLSAIEMSGPAFGVTQFLAEL